MSENPLIRKGYAYAQEIYGLKGVDTEAVMEACAQIPISMHCWQGDDVIGFEDATGSLGGIAATGNYPGRATTAEELRKDLDAAMGMIPGTVKVNLHASYAEPQGKNVGRDEISVREFQNWLDWAGEKGIGLDFNPTFFGHPLSESGFTLSNADRNIQNFWIEHGKRCREIGEHFGKTLKKPCVLNFWMPDGYKDVPMDTAGPRERMIQALDTVFADKKDPAALLDAVESKLFGLGVESYTVGSHELMMGYAISRKKLYCLDAGHFHPTEVISAKLSAVLQYLDSVLLHVSRGVRWDSDHVILLDDELMAIMNEIVRGGYTGRVHIGLDYFDASINRVAAWVLGVRNARKALLKAMLEPAERIRAAELAQDYTSRLALLEENKTLPFSAVWDRFCEKYDVPVGDRWLVSVKEYERDVLSARNG